MGRRPAVIVLAALLIAGTVASASAAFAAPIFGPFFGFGRRAPPPSPMFTYRGWSVDASRAGVRPEVAVKRIEAQLDLVARTGARSDIFAFMRGVPIIADPSPGLEPGRYVRGRGVFMRVKLLDPKKPMVLRQLLYAYQDQRLPGGFGNPDVSRFRQEAIARKAWPQTAAMLQTDPDYFAFTACAYLAGTITREPYNRANLRKTQPYYYQWLARVLDAGRPRA
jgi:hypothetical protein